VRRAAGTLGVVLLAAAAVLALAPGGGAHATTIAATPAVTPTTTGPNPATEILAIVSPIASPACGASGTATLLVPILGGVLQTDLGLPKSVSVATVLLDALGPVYIVCGDLPGSAAPHCSLDNQIAGVWPATLPSDGLAPPAPVGDLVASIDNGLRVLDLPPSAALENALQCSVQSGSTAPKAPGAPAPAPGAATPPSDAPPSPSGLPSTASLAAPSSGAAIPAQAALGSPSVPIAAAPVRSATSELSSFLRYHVPSWLLALQLIVGIVLALFLTGSWATSARLAQAWRHHRY